MKKHTVLVDLKIAMNNGYCGIAKENRLVFKMLAQAEKITPTGLLISSHPATVFSRFKQSEELFTSIEQANLFFHEALHHEPLLLKKILSKLKLLHFLFKKKKYFQLYELNAIFEEAIWRSVFSKSLSPEHKQSILQQAFCFSDLTALHLGVGSYFKKDARLNTFDYDFALFLEPYTVSVSPNTIKVIRYHDAIPIADPDFSGSVFSYRTINALKHCSKEAYFVCNSEPTREALLKLQPALHSKSYVIPCALSSNYKKIHNQEVLKQILVTRLSSQIMSLEHLPAIRAEIQNATELNYIFNLATLDPKKNHINLIRAWEKLSYQYGPKLKLIIAANRGWFSKEIEDMMRPHLLLGNMIHLENIATEEVPYLFSHAKTFVFPSYAEGFGLPPLEAMQCECPVLVSDIPAHRWVLGEAAFYCDPYHPDSIKEALERLCFLPGAETLRFDLIQKGLKRLENYSDDTLRNQWVSVFDQMKTIHRKD